MIIDTPISHEKTDEQLQVVKVCYEYAVLSVHDQIGLRLSVTERRTLQTRRRLLEGDPARHRRHHRRLPLLLPVELETPLGTQQATALNISGGGLYVVCHEPLPEGTSIQVTLGRGHRPFTFSCLVVRTSRHGPMCGLGLRFSSVPLVRKTALAS